jgi:hypothetical protein
MCCAHGLGFRASNGTRKATSEAVTDHHEKASTYKYRLYELQQGFGMHLPRSQYPINVSGGIFVYERDYLPELAGAVQA